MKPIFKLLAVYLLVAFVTTSASASVYTCFHIGCKGKIALAELAKEEVDLEIGNELEVFSSTESNFIDVLVFSIQQLDLSSQHQNDVKETRSSFSPYLHQPVYIQNRIFRI